LVAFLMHNMYSIVEMCLKIVGIELFLETTDKNLMTVGNSKAMEDRWLTVDDICKYLNVTNETVYKWIEQRNMPGHRVGRRWMFKQQKVDEWVCSGGAAEKPDTKQ